MTLVRRHADPTFPFYGYHSDKDGRKAYIRLYYKTPQTTALSIDPFPLPVVNQLEVDMAAFTKAFTSSFEATLNELLAMGFETEKLEWNEADGLHRSYAILSIPYT